MKLNTIYPVKDKDSIALGFKFMFTYLNQWGLKNTTYCQDKVMATKMLAQVTKK